MHILIFVIVAAIIGLFITITILKSIIKTAMSVLFIVSTALLIISSLIVLDIYNMKNNFGDKKSILALQDDDDMFLIAEIDPSKDSKIPFYQPDNDNVEEILQNLKDGKSEEYYKVMIINRSFFDNGLNDTINLEQDEDGYKIKKEKLISILTSNDPMNEAMEIFVPGYQKLSEERQLEEQIRVKEENEIDSIKSLFFSLALKEVIEKEGVIYILEKYNEKEIIIKPETMGLKAIRFLPIGFVKDKILESNIEEKIDAAQS